MSDRLGQGAGEGRRKVGTLENKARWRRVKRRVKRKEREEQRGKGREEWKGKLEEEKWGQRVHKVSTTLLTMSIGFGL